MKIGLAAATLFEIQPAIDFLSQSNELKHEIEIVITGVGALSSTYQLTNYLLNQSAGYMIQAGIGGSFNHILSLGETVLIRDEVMGDTGVEENGVFKDLFDLGFSDPTAKPYTDGRMANPTIGNWEQFGLPIVSGITVNEITTREKRISNLYEKYHCDIESMEGAAFHYVCLNQHIPFIQLRSVSNYIGERDKKKWKLRESITNLNVELIKILQQIP